MRIIVPKEIANKLFSALKKAEDREIKGACFARFVEDDVYEIEEVYISHKIGSNFFSNLVIDYRYKRFEKAYYKKNNYDFEKHNYIGDWHSHPLFDCIPSNYDINELEEELEKSNANFLVQLIVKISFQKLIGRCFFLSKGSKTQQECILEIIE